MCARFYLLLVFISLPTQVLRAAEEIVATPVSLPLHEEYRQEVPVSGRLLVGMSVVTDDELTAELALLAPNRDIDGMFCMQLMSRDGSYWSQNSFRLPSGEAGLVRLEYPSPYLERLYDDQAKELAVLAKLGPCAEAGLPLIAGWRSSQLEDPERITLFINSARTYTFVAGNYDGVWDKPAPCSPIEDGRRTAYDTSCELDFNDGLQAVKILRRRYDRMLPPEVIRLGAM